jgi:starch-binding outer membrane protein SusE/F
MKKISSILSFAGLMLLIVSTGCEKEKGINLNLTPSKALSAPADGASVTLTPASNASVVFEWEAAQAADGALVTYEVAFAGSAGDFNSPIYKVVSDGNGVQNRATVSHKTLNQIANYAGIASLATGEVKWTVLASKGNNVKPAEQTRNLQITRPAGFSDLPADVYLTGEATEAGTNVTQALKMRQTANGEYEIYTSLKPGSYAFVDRPTESARTFSIDGALIKEGGTTAFTGDAKVYRISLDFNNAAAKLTQIEEVGLWFSPQKAVIVTLPYVGNSTWKVENTPIEFFQEGWGRDERYKFRLTVKDASGQQSTEFMGSVNADNQRPDANTPESFYYLVPVNNSDYDFTFKFRSELDKAKADIAVLLSPELTHYTHQITIR